MDHTRIPEEKKYIWLRLVSILVISGAIGNVIDRLFRQYVVDFIYFELINFPIFNVADMYVVIAAILLIFLVLFVYKEDTDFDFMQLKRGILMNNWTIRESESGQRIDRIISDTLTDTSRSYIQKLIKEDRVYVNLKPVKANYKVKAGDTVEISFPEPVTPDIESQNIPLDIVYEDRDVLLVNKPKDMVVHPSAGHMDGTLVNGLLYHCKDSLSSINGVMRPGIVHRIDKDTTECSSSVKMINPITVLPNS